MIKIIISGACGKMGSRIFALATNNNNLKVSGVIESKGHPMLGNDLQDTAGQKYKLQADESLPGMLGSADVLVEFTSAAASISHAVVCAKMKKAVVIGTTGLSSEETGQIKKCAESIPVVMAPNMSIGVNLLFKLVGEVAKAVPTYNVEIVEAHHNQKKDSPSGTAIKLAENINIASGGKLNYIYGRKGITGARKPDEIGILSVRAGDIIGEHTVIFAGTGERIELTHRAHSRDTFAAGALLAAVWVADKKPGFYDMQDVLSLR